MAKPPADAQVQDVVGHPALVITRNVEWGTVIFGFEQANKYTIYDQEGNVIALLAEELGSFGKEVGRQLLRTRRPFTATIFSPDGNVQFKTAHGMLICYRWTLEAKVQQADARQAAWPVVAVTIYTDVSNLSTVHYYNPAAHHVQQFVIRRWDCIYMHHTLDTQPSKRLS